MLKGRVKWFDAQKGYGFIQTEETNQNVFVHFIDITGGGKKGLQGGDWVEFELQETPLGPRAINVRSLTFPSTSPPG